MARLEDNEMRSTWQSRQAEMEAWYKDLAAKPDDAVESMVYELRPHADFLRRLRGRILDIGGGAGLTSMFLPLEAELVILDPSEIWLNEPWPSIRRQLSPERSRPQFVVGFGENLPFDASAFDATMSFWSLNHAKDPARCVDEIHRVLKPGGKALLVLEDMEPSWWNIVLLAAQDIRVAMGKRPENPLHWHQENLETAIASARRKLSDREWPLQDDHLRIQCTDLECWIAGKFRKARRDWIGGYLCYELTRI